MEAVGNIVIVTVRPSAEIARAIWLEKLREKDAKSNPLKSLSHECKKVTPGGKELD